MFSDRYVNNWNAFNVLLNIGMITYYTFWGSKWVLLFWLPNGILATYLAVSQHRKRAITKAKKQ